MSLTASLSLSHKRNCRTGTPVSSSITSSNRFIQDNKFQPAIIFIADLLNTVKKKQWLILTCLIKYKNILLMEEVFNVSFIYQKT